MHFQSRKGREIRKRHSSGDLETKSRGTENIPPKKRDKVFDKIDIRDRKEKFRNLEKEAKKVRLSWLYIYFIFLDLLCGTATCFCAFLWNSDLFFRLNLTANGFSSLPQISAHSNNNNTHVSTMVTATKSKLPCTTLSSPAPVTTC